MHVGERRLAAAVRLGEGQAAEAPRRDHEQALAERRGRQAPAQLQPFAAPARLARRHRFVGDEQVVQPRRSRQPGVQGGAQHALAGVQAASGLGVGQGRHEGLGADPGPAGEDALEMEGRQPHHRRRLVEAGMGAPALGQPGQRLFHAMVVARLLLQSLEVRIGDQIESHDAKIGPRCPPVRPLLAVMQKDAARPAPSGSPPRSPRQDPGAALGPEPGRS